MLVIAAVVDTDAGLLGALIRADLTTVDLAVADDPLARLHWAEAAGTGALGFDGLLGHEIIIARGRWRIRLSR